MASKIVGNGYWRIERNQKRAIFNLLQKNGLLDPITAGLGLTLKMIEDGPTTNIRQYAPTKFELLKIYFGDRLQPWMMKKTSGKLKLNSKDVKACFNYVSKKLNKPPEQLTKKDFEKAGFHHVLYSFDMSMEKLLKSYFGKNYSQKAKKRGFWEDKKNIRESVKWLIEEKLKIAQNEIPQKLTTMHFDENKLTTLINYYKISDLIKIAYPRSKFREDEFRAANTLALLGYAFEDVVHNLLKNGLRITYRKNEPIANCNHKVKCRPDIMDISLKNITTGKTNGDIKLFSHTYFSSTTSRYLDHGGALLIIYLNGSIPVNKIKNVDFVNVDVLVNLIKNRKERNRYKLELATLRLGEFPKRLVNLERAARNKKSSMVCILSSEGQCSTKELSGDRGMIHSSGFCVWHYRQFKKGNVNADGTWVSKVKKREFLSDEQAKYLKNNFKMKSNKDLALHIYGDNTKRLAAMVNLHLRRLNCKRSQEEAAFIAGRKLVYNEKTLKIIRKYVDKEVSFICNKLNIPDTTRNRGRIQEAMLRYNLREKITPYTKDELIKVFKNYVKKNGYVPNCRDLDKIPSLPGKGTFYRHFKTWKNFLDITGLG